MAEPYTVTGAIIWALDKVSGGALSDWFKKNRDKALGTKSSQDKLSDQITGVLERFDSISDHSAKL